MSLTNLVKSLALLLAIAAPASATPNAWWGIYSHQAEQAGEVACLYETPPGEEVFITAISKQKNIPHSYKATWPDAMTVGLVLDDLDGGQITCTQAQP
jgi:hypothetical protein